ncbi:HEAT repeat-containing protein 7A [Chelonia mydas]|uniref:HEAT repeat-containing protein 7A n=1 Tax=Chelonia mydas TaxID=8469 RepID=M7BGD7_CHEMY|nr:HEAT repeat-containing protein 7A [Chelonia mydas]
MDATTDKDPLVQEQIYNALCYLGESEPEEILNSCDEYLRQHEKMAYPHRTIILKAMEAVVKNNIACLDKSTAKIVIFLASNEMTKSKEIIYDWQQAASNVLVAVGRRFINKVMEEVLTKFQPGILPHYFIMQTFANLSVSNVFGMVPFLNSILGTMLPMLGMAKQDHMKSVFCYALQHFSESIQEYLANLDKAPDPTVRKDTFSGEIFSAHDVLFNIWLQSREAKLRLAVVKALGPMSHLLPSEKLEEQLPKLVPGILALYKKHTEAFYVTKSLCQILEASVNVGSRTLDTQLDALLSNLHPQICAPVESSVPLSLKNHNEVLRCFTVLACTFPDRLLGFLLPKLENHNERIRAGTLIIMRQIINCAPSQMEIKKSFILSSMKLPLQDNSDKQPRKQMPEADDLTSDSVQNISINTLFLISTTVDRMDEGLASGFGICAINHLDETLAKLEDFVKSDIFKKSVGLFSIFKDRSDNEAEKIKSTLILCYGYVARYAPKELVLSRIEADILRNIFHYFDTKDLTLKLCLIRSICMISQAIYNSVQSDAFIFSRKAELLAQMMEFIKTEPLDLLRTPIRQRAMISCTYLVILEPPLSEPEHVELIDTCLSSVLALPPLDVLKERDGHVPDALHKETLYCDTISALKELLKSMLQKDLTPHGLQSMFEHLGPWIRSNKEHERERAVEVSATLLEFYRDKLNVSTVVPFYNLGVLVALFSPRCSDSLASIRLCAVDCAYYLLYIQLCYEGFAHDYRDEMVERLKDLKKGLEDPDFTILFNTCYNIAMVIGKRLPPDQLMSLLLTMFEGLADPDQNCSRAAAVMINALLKERGGVLLEKVPVIMALIHSKLQEVDEEHLRKAAQQTVYILASQHKTAVVSSLLGSSLPFDSHTCAMWKALATEPTLTPQILELLLDKVNRDVPYKENKSFLLGSTYERIATPLPFAATCALHEIMSAPESGAAVLGLYPHLFVALLLRVSCTVGVQLPKNLQSKERKSTSRSQGTRNLDPCSCAVEALRAMLTQGGSDEVVKSVESAGGWELMKSSDRHHDGIMLLARAMAKHAGPKLPLIVKNLFPMLNSVYDRQRITTTAFFAELLNSSVASDLILLESMMDNMTGRQKDPCTLVRMLALRGLGNISSGSPDKVRKHGAQLLASMVNGMDDKDDPDNVVALEAMSSLSKLLDHVEERDIRSMLLHIAIRIRPFFDNENHELRTSSIVLFGNLTKFSAGNCEDVFFEQILNGLVTLLLHLQDPKPEVIKACKFALRMCGPNMGCEGLCDMFLNHLHEDRSLHYGEFMNDVCKHLMQNYPEMLNRLISTNLFYFKSNWVDIRAAAPMFIGKMQNYPEMLNRLISTNLFYFKSNWVDIRAAAPMFIGFLVLHVDEEHCKQVDLDQLLSCEVQGRSPEQQQNPLLGGISALDRPACNGKRSSRVP